MAFLGGVSFGGVLGGGQQTTATRIIGIDTSLIAASVDAKLTQRALASLSTEDRAALNYRQTTSEATPPWQLEDPDISLNQRIREVRDLTKFIDLSDKSLKALSNNPDTQATFALYKAISNLKVLADYASQDSTPLSSLDRLNAQFQKGLDEIRDYLSTAKLDNLDLFLGEKQYKSETTTRLGKNGTSVEGTPVAATGNDILSGLTGTEVFTVSITKSGVTDDIVVDLSGLVGDLSLNNIKDYINTQIEALTIDDGFGTQVPKHLTRFDVARDATTGKYELQIDGTLTEEISLSAAAAEPALYIASAVTQLDDSYAVTSRLTEITGLSGTLSVDNVTSFAAIDVEASEVKALVDDTKKDELDPKIAALRDKMRAAALKDVSGNNDTPAVTDENATSLTNISSANKVNADTTASKVAVDSKGGVYVVGTSTGSFGHQVNTASGEDVFLTKFDSEGNVVYSRLLGVGGDADVYSVTVDGNDNVIVAGQTDSALSTSDVIDSKDAFVTKFSKNGDEIFRYQLDTFGESGAYSVAVDSSNNIFVGGYTKSGISATSGFSGGQDALILKLDGATGTLVDSNVFGSIDNEVIKGIAVDANDNLVVATEQAGNAVVYRIDGTNLANQTDSVDFGSLGNGGSIQSIAIDNANNSVYLAGVTTNGALDAGGTATVNGTAAGGFEGFVSGLSLNGASALTGQFTTYVSTSGTDRIADIVVSNQTVYVAGTTAGTLSGETAKGASDAFVARIDGATGAIGDIEQIGESLAKQSAGGLAFTTKGNSVLSTLGLPTGDIKFDQTRDIQTQTSARVGDYFYISFDGGTKKKISLEDGDTFDDITRKLRIAGFSKLKVEVSTTSEGAKLKISALDKGAEIDLIPGSGDRDLLSRIGLEPGKLLPKNEVYGIGETDKKYSKDNLGGAYGLGLGGAIHIGDKATAKYVIGLLDSASSTMQRAYRSLTYDPVKAELLNKKSTSGAVPAYLTQQIANLQSGLARLQANSSSTYNFFA